MWAYLSMGMLWLGLFIASAPCKIAAEPLLLTPLVQAGKFDEARQRSAIIDDSQHPQKSYGHSGYFTVPASRRPDRANHIFFWYQPCTACAKPSAAPFIIWLQGGPGGTGTFGAFAEIGNYYIDRSIKIRERCFSWCRENSCLFVDQPVQTGFSFQTDWNGHYKSSEIEYTQHSDDAAEQIYGVLIQFRKVFQETRTAPFHIMGESYGGIYTAQLGQTIAKKNKESADDVIPFVGLMVGDPLLDWRVQMPLYPETLHRIGLLTKRERDQLETLFSRSVELIHEGKCSAAFQLWNSFWNDDGSITWENATFTKMTGSTHTMNLLLSKEPDDFDWLEAYTQNGYVQQMFHISGLPMNPQMDEGGQVYAAMVKSGDWCSRSSDIYAKLFLEEGIDLIIYAGNQDPLLGAPPTEAAVLDIWKTTEVDKLLHEAPKDIWRLDSRDPTSLAGYAHCVANPNFEGKRFCYTVVRNAGHILPYDQERYSYDLVRRFLRGQSFNSSGDDPSAMALPCAPIKPVLCRAPWETPLAAEHYANHLAASPAMFEHYFGATVLISIATLVLGIFVGVLGHMWLTRKTQDDELSHASYLLYR